MGELKEHCFYRLSFKNSSKKDLVGHKYLSHFSFREAKTGGTRRGFTTNLHDC